METGLKVYLGFMIFIFMTDGGIFLAKANGYVGPVLSSTDYSNLAMVSFTLGTIGMYFLSNLGGKNEN